MNRTAGSLERPFDPVGYLLRVRRRLDLSQRDLAGLLAVSPATVARWESGIRSIDTLSLERVLQLSEFRLAVLDAHGAVVVPVPKGTVRDHAGRRLPAHLDAEPPDLEPWREVVTPRSDRPRPNAWFRHRAERDRRTQENPLRERPVDHPTTAELELRRRLIHGRQPHVDPAPVELDCSCLDECFELACLGPCPCQCEPRR